SFRAWLKQAERDDPRRLFMTREDLLREAPVGVTRQAFPDTLAVGSIELPLQYHLEPGAEDDGVTLRCPLAALNQLDRRRLDWLVPGLIAEKVACMIRSLPRDLRKSFVPAPQFAQRVVQRIAYGEGDLR